MARTLKIINGDEDSTKIQWTWTLRPDGTYAPGYTFNPWTRCTEASPACDHCYARVWAGRAKHPRDVSGNELPVWGPDAPRDTTSARNWSLPFKWQADAKAAHETRKVFCASLADVFEDHHALDVLIPAPTRQLDPTGKLRKTPREWLWVLIGMTPNLIWMLLTKRPENILGMVPPVWVTDGFPPNVWVGATVENQEWACRRIPALLDVPAVVLFLSCEPLLGPIELMPYIDAGAGARGNFMARHHRIRERRVSLVIVGGESGHGARSSDLAWYRSIVRQCEDAGIDPFVKQMGAKPIDRSKPVVLRDGHGGDMTEWAEDLRVRRMPTAYMPGVS